MNIELKLKALNEVVDCKTVEEAALFLDAFEELVKRDERRKIISIINTNE